MYRAYRPRQYKVFDFKTGNTYLIGEFPSKREAMAHCKSVGIYTIPQTLVALSNKEYERAIAKTEE